MHKILNFIFLFCPLVPPLPPLHLPHCPRPPCGTRRSSGRCRCPATTPTGVPSAPGTPRWPLCPPRTPSSSRRPPPSAPTPPGTEGQALRTVVLRPGCSGDPNILLKSCF